jgi:threonine synthase
MRERCQFLRDVAEASQTSATNESGGGFFSIMGATKLTCRECGADYALEALYVCDRCFGPLEVRYEHDIQDVEHARRRIQGGPQNIWRYHDFLPLEGPQPRTRTGLPAGCTPLVRADRLAARLGIREVWVKNDAANPTHSFKDRVVSVASTRARELGFDTLACASTGNLANSVAAHGAALGMETYVFIPSDLEEQKVLATGVYGTRVVKVKGNYDDVNRLCTELSGERDWAFVNVNVRPYYAEGSKTLSYEIAEQLGWETPDRVVAPIASGSLYTKIAKGFEEWRELGLVRGEAPIMNGAQAEGCSPVASAYAAGADFCKPVRPDTIAKSLAIGNPADGPYALDLARRSGGAIDAVTDDAIRAGIRLLAETTGIFTETAGGVTTAVLAKLAERGDIDPDERVVVVITGEGLKTLDAVRGTFEAFEISPSYDQFVDEVEGAEVRA